ncbi:hypothetical protein DPMN_087220 [Dreissena polymorpha]|uniref:HTH CENPB-type domain-containing protein n=1 Tax=Dreissena polymorpha TaxID=45954 RepID=A0A9D4KSU7_DREPO|nr:hypothetical protein DPMN_087220 [Dreissena polymorpha]
MSMRETVGNLEIKRQRPSSEFGDLNTLVYRLFMDATARLVNVTGLMIQEKAQSLAVDLKITKFKGSNGWLDRFLKRNNIVFNSRVGERGEVCEDTVKNWKDSLSEVCQGYDPSDIFNMDESGVFYHDTAKTTFFKKGDSCSGGKASKQRNTIALCASMTGKCFCFETPFRFFSFG